MKDYKAELINLITNIKDKRFLAFLYGLVDGIVKHVESLS